MKNKNIKTRFQNCNVSKQPFKLFCITVLFLFFCYDSYLSSAEYMEYELMQRYNSPMFGEIDTDLDEQKCLSIKIKSENGYRKVDEEDEREESIQDSIENLIRVNYYQKSLLREAGQCSICFLGLTGGIPLLSIAERAAGHSLFLEIYFGSGTLIDNGITTAWYLDNYYAHFFSHTCHIPHKKENQYSFFKNLFSKNNLKHTILTCLALLDTVPVTYVAYKYNNSKIYPALEFFSEFGVKVFGYYKFFDHFVLQKDNKKNEYLYKTNVFFSHLLSTSHIDAQKENIDNLNILEEINNENIENFLKQIERASPSRSPEFDIGKQRFVNRAKLLYVALFIANAIKRGTFAYRGMKTVFDSDLQAILLSIPSTLSSFGVAYFSINSLIERVGSYLYKQNDNLDFISVFHSGYSHCICMASLILAFSSAYSFSYATHEILGQIYPPEITYAIVLLTIINGTLVDSFSLREGINHYLTMVYSYYGTVQEKRILKIKKYLGILQGIILNMTEDQFSKLCTSVQDESVNDLEL